MRAELLALLEGRGHRSVELAGWLQKPMPEVLTELSAMRKDGLIRQVGNPQRWVLIGYIVPRTVSTQQQAWNKHVSATIGSDVHQAQAKQSKKSEVASWWVGLGRDELQAEANRRSESMSASKMASTVKSPIVGWKAS